MEEIKTILKVAEEKLSAYKFCLYAVLFYNFVFLYGIAEVWQNSIIKCRGVTWPGCRHEPKVKYTT